MQITIEELAKLFSRDPGAEPWKIGRCYLVRTVTMTQVGRLTWVGPHEIVLADAAWVADTGRFFDALEKGTLNEVEPFIGDVIVGRGSIVDACEWQHPVKMAQK